MIPEIASAIASAVGGIKSALAIVETVIATVKDRAVQEKLVELRSIVITLQMTVLDLQGRVFSLQDTNMDLKKALQECEATVGEYEQWDKEKGEYALVSLGRGSCAFVHQREKGLNEAEQYFCPICFEAKKKSVLLVARYISLGALLKCPVCGAEVIDQTAKREHYPVARPRRNPYPGY